jgi:glyoxylase-like metal-dependent hydrolase (beta-lactamase superfamily II)
MALEFNRKFDPRHGTAVHLAPGVRRVTAPNPGPFTFHGTNTFLIGDEEIAVLDPGPADPAHIKALLAAIGSANVSCILVSHSHRDHSAGAPLLQLETGAPILAAGRYRRIDLSGRASRTRWMPQPIWTFSPIGRCSRAR